MKRSFALSRQPTAWVRLRPGAISLRIFVLEVRRHGSSIHYSSIFPTPSKAGRQFNALWKTDTGFSFDILSFEQDPKEFESKTLGWAWFDEPPPKAIFDATVARIRRWA